MMTYYFSFLELRKNERLCDQEKLNLKSIEKEEQFATEKLISPPETVMKNILDFARSYVVLPVKKGDYAEINLN